MGQQEYNASREQMKRWMLDNGDIHDEFELTFASVEQIPKSKMANKLIFQPSVILFVPGAETVL